MLPRRNEEIELSLKEVKKPVKFTTILYMIVIAMGILFRLGSYIQDRTLWYDEAMLASGIVQRGFGGLFKPLDYSQSAPIGFILIVKFFITVLGSSQRALRLYSFLTGLFSIRLFYLLIKRSGFKRPLLGTAFYATVSPLIYYSTELKPYMPDAFFTIAALYLYKLYEDKDIPGWVYALFCIFAVWISFPSIFVIGAITCYNFFFGIFGFIARKISKNEGELKELLRAFISSAVFGAVALVSFGACYFIYTSKVSGNIDGMSMEYWKHLYFPLFPKKLFQWNLIYLMLNNYFSFSFNDVAALSLILWVGGIMLLFIRKNKLGGYTVLAVLFTLVASWLEQYPIQDRLLLFLVPFTILGILFFAEVLMDLLRWKFFEVVVFILIIALNYGSLKYTDVKNMYREGQEAAYLIYYLNNKIEEDEKLYIFANAVPIYEYKTGYKQGLTHFPEKVFEDGQLIYGCKYWNLKCEPYKYITTLDEERLKENVDSIIKYQKVYVLFYHYGSDAEYYLINELRKYGTVTYFMNENETPLYYFVRYAHLN
ncbi:MAG TPA: glycosyltransferase family 39 protein [Acetivibrio clariflavus]|nr:glycosyltransferase family 39 protein [Acetivibrio clariflavus]HPU40796.1 glycosyltransferase family 39 protein [Acetivibrio clariflavus]